METDLKSNSTIFFSFHNLSFLDQRFNDQNIVRELDTMVIDLQAKLKLREQELDQLKQNEEKRLHFLRTAMLDYINRGTKIN